MNRHTLKDKIRNEDIVKGVGRRKIIFVLGMCDEGRKHLHIKGATGLEEGK